MVVDKKKFLAIPICNSITYLKIVLITKIYIINLLYSTENIVFKIKATSIA